MVRVAWLVVGATLALVVGMELLYRAQVGVKHRIAAVAGRMPAEPPSPFDSTAWAKDYMIEYQRSLVVQWAPYVYRSNPPFDGRYISVDARGHRVTPSYGPASAPAIRVFFLGGSTMFGWFHRNENAIPADAARRLAAILGTHARVEATNFGVPGHTSTQEIIDLMLRLRAGARPDIVVFYDGINDVMSTVQNGVAGFPQNEANRVNDFRRGRHLAAISAPGIVNDVRTLRDVGRDAVARVQFVDRILAIGREVEWRSMSVDSLASSLADVYTGNAQVVEALASRYGFEPIYIWQPALFSTRKRLTAREQWLRQAQAVGDVHVRVPSLIASGMAKIAGNRFIDATRIFDDDTLDVFIDTFGHTFERGSARVVDTLMPVLSAAVARSEMRSGRSP